MATTHNAPFNFSETRQQFEQSKPPSTGFQSRFMHKRNNSVDSGNLPSPFTPLASPPAATPAATTAAATAAPAAAQHHIQDHVQPENQQGGVSKKRRPVSLAYPPRLQVETQIMGQQWLPNGSVAIDSPRSTTKTFRDNISAHLDAPRSPAKSALSTFSARFSKEKAAKDVPPSQPKKSISSTNLKKGLLSRPKSNKNLRIATDKDVPQAKNKENRKPSDPTASPITPIYAQFCKGPLDGGLSLPPSPYERHADTSRHASLLNLSTTVRPPLSHENSGSISRRKSFQPHYTPPKPDPTNNMTQEKERRGRHKADESVDNPRTSTWARARSGSRARLVSALSSISGHKSKSASPTPEPEPTNEPHFDINDVDKHLEAMLDRRNIPENQRYKMRNLSSTIKMEFIRQDWAENEGKSLTRKPTNDSDDSGVGVGKGSVRDVNEKNKTRGRTFTFSRNSWRIGASPAKGKKKEASAKGHNRTKSTEAVTSERPTSSAGTYSSNGILAKVTGQQPSDFVNYLRKVQKPENVEVGKLHKLRLLLRNERVAWTEDFIKQGGMKEIVGLLQRIMDVEWR